MNGEIRNMIDEIIKIIADMALKNGFSEYQVFTDWIQCTANSIQNASCLLHDKAWNKREKEYLDIFNKYKDNTKFSVLTGLLACELEENISDVLGHVYMASGMGSKAAGQFFTPFHLSYLTASVGLDDRLMNDEIITLNEPSIGGGGMVIGLCKALNEHGINYQKKLRVIGQDLDWKGVYMSYVQLSLLGVDAVIVQGDSLATPYNGAYPKERTYRTPRNLGVLL